MPYSIRHIQEYQQTTLASQRQYNLKNGSRLNLYFSFDSFEIRERRGDTRLQRADREDEYQGKVLYLEERSNWNFAFGGEISLQEQGLKPHTYDEYKLERNTAPWSTYTFSPLGEVQFDVSDDWTVFASARADKNKHTSWLASPRLAVTHALDTNQYLKLILNRSVRKADDLDLRNAYEDGKEADNEIIHVAEIRFDDFSADHQRFGVAAFFQDVEILAWQTRTSTRPGQIRRLGEYTAWGFEFEYQAEFDQHRLMVSYGYTDLIRFTVGPDGSGQNFSAAPYGYGNDLTHWAKHTAQLSYFYEYTHRMDFSASLRILSNFDGLKNMGSVYTDLSQVEPEVARPNFASRQDLFPGYEAAFRPNAYLNLGARYQLTSKIGLSLDIHNALGFIDEDLNKRNQLAGRGVDYRIEAPAFSIGISGKL